MHLPKATLLSKEETAEHSRMESILHHARRAEEGINQTAMWYDTRCTMRAERLTQRTENIPRNIQTDEKQQQRK